MSSLCEITAVFLHERYRFDETVIGAIRLVNGEAAEGEASTLDWLDEFIPEQLAVKGLAEPDELQPHCTYRFYGRWTSYKNKRTQQTERQFAFQTFTLAQPHGRAGVIAYLRQAGKGNGIGQARATQLWEKFGSDAVRILRENPEVASAAIRGLSTEQAKAASAWLVQQQALESCTIDLTDLLSGRGFLRDTARRAIGEWGNRAAEIIRRDPYSLMNFRGCGFKRCDALWLELGLPPTKLRRQALSIWYALASDTNGHTWFPVEFAFAGLKNSIGGSDLRPERALRMAEVIGRLNPERHGAVATIRSRGMHGPVTDDADGRMWVAEGAKANAEADLAQRVADAMDEPVFWPSIDSIQDIDDHQRGELAKALTGTVGVFGGSPGTGKTWTAARLVRALIEQFGIESIGIGAPTGKAAVRLSELMDGYGVPLRAKTWHSLLGVESGGGAGGWSFKHHAGNPLRYSFLIGDESSMLDTSLMASIFRARAHGTHVLLIGDVNQLPPVGHGAPLRDLIAAGLPYGELREIKRNSGGIVETCAAIRDGKPWQPGDNLVIRSATTPERQIEEMLEEIREARTAGLDPIWDVQVLVAVNKKSPLSRKAVNELLQHELNPGSKSGGPFKLGDKIVNTKNGFFPLVELANPDDEDLSFNDKGEVYVANGELAKVIHVEEKLVVAHLSSPDRTIKIPRGKEKESDGDEAGQGDDDRPATGCSWDLGYGLSCHKSQGSEFPVVIVLIDDYPGARMVCDRSWIYTAISRAKSRCVLVGKKGTADRFCRKTKIWDRKTFLKELIRLKKAQKELVEL